jgi:hypothetical protein
MGKGLEMTIQMKDDNGQVMPVVKFAATQSVSYDGSVQSTAVSATVVRLVATTDCHVQIGVNPTASGSTSAFLPSGVVEYIGIKPGDKVAAIKQTGGTAGTLFVTECA